ncbi:MAG TPA: biopolymer transporter ExbD [Patescibacteria group bacterium]|nr:biopolymer transporter ExbD [Patescibacteria group bacterium]
MSLSFFEDGDDDQVLSAINTTPLVDVMLVLLIIFLITIPVVIRTVPVHLPQEASQPSQMPPHGITIAVDRDGHVFWNDTPLADDGALAERLAAAATLDPQPEIAIRGDRDGRFEPVGKVVSAAKRAGIAKLGFITEPPPHGG